MIRRTTRRVALALGAALLAAVLVLGLLFVRYQTLEQRFRAIHPDDNEAHLLAVVGHPTSIRDCTGLTAGSTAVGAAATRGPRCARVYWYSTYVFSDGWLVPIDDDGSVMQIRRLALP